METYLQPSIKHRKLSNKLDVYSFFSYDDVAMLLHTKHDPIGYRIFQILAKQSMRKFAKTYDCHAPIAAIGIDDHVRHGYSHTAILTRGMRSKCIRARYGVLRAASTVSYAGKSFEFRLANPRNFALKTFPETEVILIDDIVTSGLTLTQAAEVLRSHGKVVRFALVVGDAER